MEIPDILRALDAQIAQLQQARQILSEASSTPSPAKDSPKRQGRPPAAAKAETKPAGKRIMSDEGKARIVAGQKKRWAKSRKAARAAAPVIAKKATTPAKTTAKKNVVPPAKKAVAAPVKKAPVKAAVPAKPAVKKAAPPVKKATVPAKKAVAKKTPAKKAAVDEPHVLPVTDAEEKSRQAENTTAPETAASEAAAEE